MKPAQADSDVCSFLLTAQRKAWHIFKRHCVLLAIDHRSQVLSQLERENLYGYGPWGPVTTPTAAPSRRHHDQGFQPAKERTLLARGREMAQGKGSSNRLGMATTYGLLWVFHGFPSPNSRNGVFVTSTKMPSMPIYGIYGLFMTLQASVMTI